MIDQGLFGAIFLTQLVARVKLAFMAEAREKIQEKIQSIRGMNDICDPEIHLWQNLEKTIRETYESFGFVEVRTPLLEPANLFQRGVGTDTDIVEKEMYTFQDRNGDWISLRPEGTASVTRALIEHQWMAEQQTVKVYYIGPMFRYERPQKGRYRQFHQYGLEIFGVENAKADAEIIAAQSLLYEKLNLSEPELRLSSVGCQNCRPAYKEILKAELGKRLQDIPEDFHPRIQTNPQRIFDLKNEKVQKFAGQLPKLLDHLCGECKTHFDSLKAHLTDLKVKYVVDPLIVRGLDYYNRTAFEFTSQHLGAQSAVGGGGRYDQLVENIGGKATPGVGYAGGFERLVLLVEQSLKVENRFDAVVVSADEQGAEAAMKLAMDLRRAGIKTESDLAGRSLKSQMKRADKLKAKYCLILGSREVQNGTVVIKDMDQHQQAEVSKNEIVEHIKKALNV